MQLRHATIARFAALAGAVALVAACGGSTNRRVTTPRPRGSLGPVDPELRQASARGPIESITPEELAPGYPALRVVIAGETPVAERSFRIALPADVALPFAVGDAIVLNVETMPGPPTYQPRITVVTTAGGELLAMHGVTPPRGWSAEPFGVQERYDTGDYDEIERFVAFRHCGQRVVTHGGRWRRLVCPDGSWHVAGSASDLEGDRLPADGGPSSSIMIVRGR